MSTGVKLGSKERPVRVAVVGAGPAGFFLAEALLKLQSPLFDVDVFDRLPTPFGLVRAGVAPDHQKIKGVTRTFERTAKSQRFRFLGNVTVGRDLSTHELAAHYDQVVYAIGSTSDRRLGIPGEELTDSHAGTAFVGWYNAHPDFKDFPFDLSTPRAVVVGVGNVALDIARVLLRSPNELAKTDIAGHALEVLRGSQVREVVLLARRGAAHVAFTQSELQDIAELDGVRVVVDPAAVAIDSATAGTLEGMAKKNVEYLQALASAPPKAAERTLRIELYAAPVELLGGDGRRVRGVKVERTEVVDGKARGTGTFFEVQAGVVFRSIGYFGVPLPGVPFDEKRGVIPNVDGRVIQGGAVVPGCYSVGWIRRGPLGVIGTNKADAHTVAQRMVEDVPRLTAVTDAARSHTAVDELLANRGVRVASYSDWLTLDAEELARGEAQGKVREKFASVEQMMNQLLRDAAQG